MLGNIRIGHKIMAATVAAIVMALAIGLTGCIGLARVRSHLEDISQNYLPGVWALGSLAEGQASIAMSNRILSNPLCVDPALRRQQYVNIRDNIKQVDEAYKVFEPLPQTAEEARLWNQFVPLWEQWRRSVDQLLSLEPEKDRWLASHPKQVKLDILPLDRRIFQTNVRIQGI